MVVPINSCSYSCWALFGKSKSVQRTVKECKVKTQNCLQFNRLDTAGHSFNSHLGVRRRRNERFVSTCQLKEEKRMENKQDALLWKDRKRYLGLPLSFTRYSIKNKRLYVSIGFLSIEENELLLYRVLDIHLKRSLMDRIFGVGTVTLYTSDKTNRELVLKNIKNPTEVRNFISELVESERERLKIRGREILGIGDEVEDELL